MKYYGEVIVRYQGWFEADGIEEIVDDPVRCATNVEISTYVDYMEEDADGDE